METLSVWGEFLGGVGVMLSLIFLGVQTRASNRLALAASQREQRHIWQEMMFYIGNNTSEYRELLNNFDAMEPDRQTKAVVILFAMGNQLDTLLKLNAEGLETDDNLRYVMDAFVGHISTPGGYTFWQKMSAIDLYGSVREGSTILNPLFDLLADDGRDAGGAASGVVLCARVVCV